MNSNLKTCSVCTVEKPATLEFFYKDRRSPSGLTYKCKECNNKKTKEFRLNNQEKVKKDRSEWYFKNKEHISALHRSWRKDNPERRLFRNAKNRAKKKGIEFNLDLKDIIIPTYCPVLGILIDTKSSENADNCPSLDRVHPSLGYIKGNVNVISNRANRIKNDATGDELRKIADYVQRIS